MREPRLVKSKEMRDMSWASSQFVLKETPIYVLKKIVRVCRVAIYIYIHTDSMGNHTEIVSYIYINAYAQYIL